MVLALFLACFKFFFFFFFFIPSGIYVVASHWGCPTGCFNGMSQCVSDNLLLDCDYVV